MCYINRTASEALYALHCRPESLGRRLSKGALPEAPTRLAIWTRKLAAIPVPDVVALAGSPTPTRRERPYQMRCGHSKGRGPFMLGSATSAVVFAAAFLAAHDAFAF